jgi:dGTPase
LGACPRALPRAGLATTLDLVTEIAGRVADSFEATVREQEERFLSPLAVRSYQSLGRAHDETPCRLRTPFQRDRDRIVHSKSFRRLKHKTQVFIDPPDHYRTRLTHTLETATISRTVARALRLNEDLTEAIGLGHDLGHPAFGHAGEAALDHALQERFGRRFRHNEHSLRVVDVLERDGRGLNLTQEVRDGILRHTGPEEPATLEGRIVRLVDRVAYINHDIDDAIRHAALRPEELPAEELELLGPTGSQRIDRLIHDLVETSQREGDIVQSQEIGEAMLSLRRFMFEHVYLGPEADAQHRRAQRVIRRIFDDLVEHPEKLPDRPDDLPDRIADYIAGMTDRFALSYADGL